MTHQTQAVLLLTAHLGKSSKDDPKPLSPTEWGRFAQWMKDHGMVPEALLWQRPADVLSGWADLTVTQERIQHLLDRAGALGLAIERWERAGLWVITRSDPDYPTRLEARLKSDSPPFFFGCGNRNLLTQGGVAVIGSRDATEEDLAFTARLGAQAALEGISVVSGGARGVDEAAMLGALELEGTVVGVLSDSLLRTATSIKYRNSLMSGNLVLVSPFNPEAGFDVGNAMARNKYIYCLADASVVITTGIGKGGTWNGATENLRNGWVSLWVKPNQDTGSGNFALVQRGASWLPTTDFQLSSLCVTPDVQRGIEQAGLFDRDTSVQLETALAPAGRSSVSDAPTEYGTHAQPEKSSSSRFEDQSHHDFYTLFLNRIEQLTADRAATIEQLLENLALQRSQLREWLDRAVDEGRLRKLNKPIRYIWVPRPSTQQPLFDRRP